MQAIRVRKLEQSGTERASHAELGCTGPSRVLSQTILLTDATRNHLYSTPLFDLDRLSECMLEQMLVTDRLVALEGSETRMYREIPWQQVEPCAEIARQFDLMPSEPFVSRT